MSIPTNTLCLELQSIGVNIDGTRGTIADSSGRSNNLVNWKTGVCGQTLVHLTACIGCSANRLCAMKHNAHTWLHRFLSTTTKRVRKKKQNEKKTLTPATLNGHIWWNDRNHWANLGKKAAYFHCSHKCSSRQLHQCHRNIPHWSESHARVRLTFVSIECYRRSAVAPDRDLIKKRLIQILYTKQWMTVTYR